MPRELLKTKDLRFVCLLLAGLAVIAAGSWARAETDPFAPASVCDPSLRPELSQVSLASLVVEGAEPAAAPQVKDEKAAAPPAEAPDAKAAKPADAKADKKEAPKDAKPAVKTGNDAAGMNAEAVYGMASPAKYKGKPISLDFKDIDILDVFVLISEVSGFNVVVDPDVKGRITIRLDNVPWDQALEVILKNQGLGKEVEGNVMRIANMIKLRDENVLKRQMADAEQAARPRDTRILYLSYAKAGELEALVRKVLSTRGDIIVDERTNSMIVVDVPESLEKGVNLIKELDVRTRQVSINAQVVATTKNFARNLGIQWGGRFMADKYHGNTTGYRFPNNYAIGFDGGSDGGYAVNLPSGNAQLLDLKFGNILDTFKLQAALTASESDGLTKTISNPRVTTSDNTTALVESGYDMPYAIVNADTGAQSVSFVSATLKLRVTPHITNDKYINMQLEVTKNTPDFANAGAGGTGTPIIKNVANSRVLVKDGETIVVGGLNETTNGTAHARIPFLGSIPVLGLLFKNHTSESKYNDLLYFITPTIIVAADEVVREGEIF